MNSSIQDGYLKLKAFPGATIGRLDYYSKPTLVEDKPEIVLLHVGINNLLNTQSNNVNDNGIAEEIIEMGRNCQNHHT